MHLRILYRGPLESCNYGCVYCPFAKKVDSRAGLLADRRSLDRFVAWVASRSDDAIGVLITPWGEGLIRRWYQDALVALTHLPNVERAAIQTNLSCRLDWATRAVAPRLALWATYHPGWTARAPFVAKVCALHAMGIRVSCGVVGLLEHADEIDRLRADLPADVYLWINAAKTHSAVGYAPADLARFEAIDPLFRLNTRQHPSFGRPCRTGESVVSVDGRGDVRRCHFVREVIGNLYDGTFDAALRERPCPNATCGCHIGYVHLDDLELYGLFGDGVLERIPSDPLWQSARRRLALVPDLSDA